MYGIETSDEEASSSSSSSSDVLFLVPDGEEGRSRRQGSRPFLFPPESNRSRCVVVALWYLLRPPIANQAPFLQRSSTPAISISILSRFLFSNRLAFVTSAGIDLSTSVISSSLMEAREEGWVRFAGDDSRSVSLEAPGVEAVIGSAEREAAACFDSWALDRPEAVMAMERALHLSRLDRRVAALSSTPHECMSGYVLMDHLRRSSQELSQLAASSGFSTTSIQTPMTFPPPLSATINGSRSGVSQTSHLSQSSPTHQQILLQQHQSLSGSPLRPPGRFLRLQRPNVPVTTPPHDGNVGPRSQTSASPGRRKRGSQTLEEDDDILVLEIPERPPALKNRSSRGVGTFSRILNFGQAHKKNNI